MKKTTKTTTDNTIAIQGKFTVKGKDLIAAVIPKTNTIEEKQRIFDYFTSSKITPRRLMEWLADANKVIAGTGDLTNEQRTCSGDFLWWIGAHFLPVFTDPTASEKTLVKTLWEAFTLGDGYDYYRGGISNIGVAFLEQKGASSPSFIKNFMMPLSMFREIVEILADYEVSERLEKKTANC